MVGVAYCFWFGVVGYFFFAIDSGLLLLRHVCGVAYHFGANP